MSADAKLSKLRNVRSYIKYIYTYYWDFHSVNERSKTVQIYIALEIMSHTVLLHNSITFLLVSVPCLLVTVVQTSLANNH